MSVPTQWSSAASSATSGLDTALTLRLPGSDPDPDCPSPTAAASDSPPSTMAQVVGWPPVRSFRKNALPAAASWHRPCSVRLHGDLILSHGPRRVGAKGLDHRLEIVDPAVLESDEACSDLIHGMLADAPATAGYDLAEDNWTYCSPALTPLDIAMASVRRFRGEIEKRGAAAGIEFDIELPELWVTLVYSEPKTLLLACKEAAAKTEATGRKRRRESDEPCAICLAEVDTRDEGTVTLPCSHAFHCGCIITWFHREWTCPTCRCDIMECFSFVRSPSAEQLTDDVDEDEPEIEEPWLYLGDRYVPFFHYPDDVDEASNSEDEFVDNIDFSDPELLEGEEFADSEAQSEQLL